MNLQNVCARITSKRLHQMGYIFPGQLFLIKIFTYFCFDKFLIKMYILKDPRSKLKLSLSGIFSGI